MPHISSLEHDDTFKGHHGAMSPNPQFMACLRVGSNGGDGGAPPAPEFSLSDARPLATHGRLTWDPDHRRNGAASPFYSVAAVRFDVTPQECLLSVGTGDFVRLVTAPYRWIEKVQVAATARTDTPGRAIQWDFLELVFHYADGRSETRRSNVLPRVATGTPLRRPVQAVPGDGTKGTRPTPSPQQFAEISTGSRDVVAVSVRGQVTLRANHPDHLDGNAACPLCAEDLQGRIHVYTDASAAA